MPEEPTDTSRAPLLIRDVAAYLGQARLGAAGQAFCAYLWQQTLGRTNGQGICDESNAWCDFDLAEWSKALGWTKAQRSNLLRIRATLLHRHIIRFIPDPLFAGRGRIGWTLSVEGWQPYDRRRHPRHDQARLVKYPAHLTNLAWLEKPQITNPVSLEERYLTNLASLGGGQITNLASSQGASADPSQQSDNSAVGAEQIAQWQADVMEQQAHVAQLRQVWQQAMVVWKDCLTGTQRARLRQEASLAEMLYRQEEERLAVFERFLALIAEGRTKEEALAEINAAAPSASAYSAAPAAPEAMQTALDQAEGVVALEVQAAPVVRLEGQALRKALFATLTHLFLSDPPDPTDIALERGKYNRAIKVFVQKQIQPDDLVVLKATFERVWPKATCTALGLANNLPLLLERARVLGYSIGAEGYQG